jgi:hypothetical protein
MKPQTADLQRIAGSLSAFAAAMPFHVGKQVTTFGQVAHSYQVAWLRALSMTAAALMRGDPPDQSRMMFIGTKGSGKDLMIALLVVFLVAFSPRALKIQILAADAGQAAEVLGWVKLLLKWSHDWLDGLLGKLVTLQASKLIGKRHGSEAEVIACDATGGSHGSRPDLLVVNEFTHIGKWEVVETKLDDASKIFNGAALFFGNAGFLESPSYKLYQHALEHWAPVYEWNEPATHRDRRHVADAEAIGSPSRNARLNHGIWSTGTGDFIDPADVKSCTNENGGPVFGELALRGYSCVAGLDLGVRNDHSALVTLGVKSGVPRIRLMNARWWVPGAKREVDLMAVEKGCRDDARRYSFRSLWYDPAQAQLMVQRLRRTAGILCCEMPFVSSNLDRMARTLMEVFQNHTLDLYKCDRLLADLSRIQIVEKNFGHKLESVSNSSGHADVAIALAIALPAAVELLNNFGGSSDDRIRGVDPGPPPSNKGVHLARPNYGDSGPRRHGVLLDRPTDNDGWRRS